MAEPFVNDGVSLAPPEPVDPASPESDGTAWCKRCGEEVEPEPPGRCPACKTWLPGNDGALKHGLRRWKDRGRLPENLRQTVQEFLDLLISDQGGLDNMTAARAALIRAAADMEAGKNLLMVHVLERGIDTPSGRKAYDRLLATLDRQHRALMALGLGRRSRSIDPLDAVHRAVEEANAGDQDGGSP